MRAAVKNLINTVLHPSAPMIHAIPDILGNTPPSFHTQNIKQLQENALLSEAMLSKAPGLRIIPSRGALYIFVGSGMVFNDAKYAIGWL